MNICADCQNPVNTCSWEREFKPVEGWTAKETRLLIASPSERKGQPYTTSYDVTACPFFKPYPGYKPPKQKVFVPKDRKEGKKGKKGRKGRPIIATNIVTGEEISFSSIKQAIKLGGFSSSSIYFCLAGEQYSHYGYKFRYKEDDT